MTWDEMFMLMAQAVAMKSKDLSTKVGAVIVDTSNKVRSVGYNGFPRGMNDDIEERHQRPLKYAYTEHAERNALYNAETSLTGCTIYVTSLLPCYDCARGIIQAGITRVAVESMTVPERWKESTDISLNMFSETGVTVVEVGAIGYEVRRIDENCS